MLRLAIALVLLLPATASAQVPPFGCDATPGCAFIAGTGEDITDDDSRGDGGPATEARFRHIDGLDWAGDGSILVADGQDARIRRITPSGGIVTNRSEGLNDPTAVVSTAWYPNHGFQHAFVVADVGDDAVEEWIMLIDPFGATSWRESVAMEDVDAADVEATVDTGFWVADPAAETVWLVRVNGVFGWSQAPALEALPDPRGIGPLPGGGFLVSTLDDCRIRRHTSNGTVVVAGLGFCGGRERSGHGDGGPATDAFLRFPLDVEATPDGGYVFMERERIRRVDPAGTLSTLLYTGFPGTPVPPGDGGLPQPTALEVTPDGDVLIGLDRRVLRVDTNYAPAVTTPTGAPKPQPVQPAPIVTTPVKLNAALSKGSYKVVKGKKLAFKFTSGAAGDYALTVRKGKKTKKTFKGKAKAGANTVKKKIKLKPGKYGVTLSVKAGAQTATDTAKLKVSKPR